MKRIAVFRALYLGDFLCVVPALRALRKHYPNAEITYIGLEKFEDLVRRYGQYIDCFIAFPGFPLLTEEPIEPSDFEAFLTNIRSKEYDLLFQMHGSGSVVNNLLQTFKAKKMVGFCEQPSQQSSSFLLYPNSLHEIHRHLALLKHQKIPTDGDHIDFPIHALDQEAFKWANLDIQEPYICMHPGSKAASRQWPLWYFAKIGNLFSKRGYQIVITGVISEIHLAKELSKLLDVPAIIAAGKLSLGGTAILLSKTNFLVTNCTGVSHMAAALKTPSVVISMDGEPHRWGPLNKELHRTVDWKSKPNYFRVLKEVDVISRMA